MKITKLRLHSVAIPYKGGSYVQAHGTVRAAERVICEITSDDGLTGIGETAVVVPERGGETRSSVVSNIVDHFAPAILNQDASNISHIVERMGELHQGKTGFLVTRCLIDNALYDLLGKGLNVPVYTLLGGRHRDHITVSRSLGVKAPVDMAKDALDRKASGYAMITLKCGFDPGLDLERVAAVRDAIGPDFPLEVDVNGGYSADVAVPTLKKMERHYDIRSVEQPCPWWDLDGMAKVARALHIPVIADESAWSAHDVYEIAKREAADVICIKVIKNGGFYLSRQMAETAAACGLGVSMGSKHPLGPGTAAILHFAAAMPMVSMPVGYGSPHERLVDDVISETIQFDNGTVSVPSGPGLGVSLDREKLARYKSAETVELG
jgi:muconate cycloisomerase